MNRLPIGILDSGVGGLTILNQMVKHFPKESFIYFGDSGRAPYGNKTTEELLRLNQEIIGFLIEQKIKLVISACNTSCSSVLEKIKSQFKLPIIGLIKPAVNSAAMNTKNNKIAILATKTTVKSKAYGNNLKEVNKKLKIKEIACPELVPLAENNQISSAKSLAACRKYMQKVNLFGADTLIYGCSHYPYFENNFRNYSISSDLTFINPAFR